MRSASIVLALASFIALHIATSSQAQTATRQASNDPWNSEQYQLGGGNNSRQANQYGATIGSGTSSAAPTVSPLDRTQNAVTGTASTLRDGVEAGIRQANQAGSQAISGTTNATRDLSQQFQSATGLGSQSQPTSATNWPAPPPAYSNSANAASTTRPASSSGWTSIRTEMAPPTLLAPPLVPLNSSSSGSISSTTAAGPSFPSPQSSSTQRDQFHSVLTDPTTSTRQTSPPPAATSQTGAKSPDWASSWGTNSPSPATIGQSSDTTVSSGNSNSSTLPRIGPEIPRQSPGIVATDTDVWNRSAPALPSSSNAVRANSIPPLTDDRYNPAPATSQNGANIWAGLPSQSPPSTTNAPLGNLGNPPSLNGQPSNGFANFSNQPASGQPGPGQPAPGHLGGNMPPMGYSNQNGMMGQQPMNPDQLPWMPLLAVSLALAGSFGANLYLGWSYADARHRYHLLVRRSTDSFHRATSAAA